MSITLHLQIIFALSGNMQFGCTTLTANKHHTNTAYGGYLALAADFYFIKTGVDASGSFQFDLALVGNGQFSLSVTLGSVDGSTILSTDASGGVVKCDVGTATGSNGDTHAIAADIHIGIIEGDVSGIALILDALAIAVDVQRAALYGQAGILAAVNGRALCSLDLQCAAILYGDVVSAVNTVTKVAVNLAVLVIIDLVNTRAYRVNGQAGLVLYGQVAPLYDTAAALRAGTCFRMLDIHIGAVGQGDIRTAGNDHAGRGVINIQTAAITGFVSFNGYRGAFAAVGITRALSAYADAFHIAVGCFPAAELFSFLSGIFQGVRAINGVFAL